jgi:hypothetical protein
MVKIKPSEKLKEFLVKNEMPSKSIYLYKEIRPFLLKASPELLKGCDFVWPKVKKMKPSPKIEEIRERRKNREYQEMTKSLTLVQSEPVDELRSGLGIGMSFVSILFVGALSGYYLGKYFFGFGDLASLVLSFVVCVVGVYVEVILFLLKSEGKTKKE